jgi:deoxyribonuclease-4
MPEKILVGAHVGQERPLEAAAAVGAESVQIFLGKPSGWQKPPPRDDADELRDSVLPIYVHAQYRINVCSPANNIRYGARKMLAQQCEAAGAIGADALIVHPGHAEDGIEEGVKRWKRTLEMLESPVPVWLENTAGGKNAVARRVDAIELLWEEVQAADTDIDVGFCFDTCHAHAAGEDLSDVVQRIRAITGRIDLVHANDSRDPPGTGADRHARLGDGKIDPDGLRAMIAAAGAAGAPILIETPGPRAGMQADLAYIRGVLEGA